LKEYINLPYGRSTIRLEIPATSCEILSSRIKELNSEREGKEIVGDAMRNPIGGLVLKEISKGKRKATIIISDHTRPVPSKDILPHMLAEMRQGNPNMEITLLVATGSHRGTTLSELEEKLGKDIVLTEQIVVHDWILSECIDMGTLPSGAKLYVNKIAVETDLLVAEGFIEPHFFAGYSGGRKSVLPGVCSEKTVLENHCSAFIDSPYARTGILDMNPIHEDMIDAVRRVNLVYIVNVIIDKNKKTVAAFAGDGIAAHLAGCKYVERYCVVNAKPADIVISTNGGYPMDQNMYQCVKGMTAAEATAKEGAIIIMCVAMEDGAGGDNFYKALKECESPEVLYKKVQEIPQDETRQDQWEYQILARILMKHEVIVVSEEKNRKMILDMKMSFAHDIHSAIEMAQARKGKNANISIIPDGVSVVVKAQ